MWAINYYVQPESKMLEDGLTKEEIDAFQRAIYDCFIRNSFEAYFIPCTYIYNKILSTAKDPLTSSFIAVRELREIKYSEKYMTRLHLFRIEDFNSFILR